MKILNKPSDSERVESQTARGETIHKSCFIVEQRSGSSLLSDSLKFANRDFYPAARMQPKKYSMNPNLSPSRLSEFNVFIEIPYLPILCAEFSEKYRVDLIQLMKDTDFKFFFLERRNKVRQAMSMAQMKKVSARNVAPQGTVPPHSFAHARRDNAHREVSVDLTRAEMIESIKWFSWMKSIAESVFEDYGLVPFRIYYEDHLLTEEKREGLFEMLCSIFGFQIPWDSQTQHLKLAAEASEKCYRSFLCDSYSEVSRMKHFQ